MIELIHAIGINIDIKLYPELYKSLLLLLDKET